MYNRLDSRTCSNVIRRKYPITIYRSRATPVRLWYRPVSNLYTRTSVTRGFCPRSLFGNGVSSRPTISPKKTAFADKNKKKTSPPQSYVIIRRRPNVIGFGRDFNTITGDILFSDLKNNIATRRLGRTYIYIYYRGEECWGEIPCYGRATYIKTSLSRSPEPGRH